MAAFSSYFTHQLDAHFLDVTKPQGNNGPMFHVPNTSMGNCAKDASLSLSPRQHFRLVTVLA
jgi:hypothetical protein